jgi:hypothetical protein
MKYLLFAALMAAPAFAQIVALGVKAGIPLGDAFAGSGSSDVTSAARRYLVGGTAELHLPLRFSVELDVIYKRTGFNSYFQSLDIGRFSDRVTANQWEFPLLAKYEILGGRLRPFIDAGPVLRHMSGIADKYTYLTFFPFPGSSGSTTSNNSPALQHRNSPGFSVGGGVTWKILGVRISPEVRYTRWGTDTFEIEQSTTSNPNQEDLLVGFVF